MTTSAAQLKPPSADERAGMDWWNVLSEPERGYWLTMSGNTTAAAAWVYFKAHHVSRGRDFLARAAATPAGPSDLAILRDHTRSEQRVIDEAAAIEADGEIPDDTSVAALAEMIAKDPLRFALRILNLEGHVRLQRRHLETIEQRLVGGAR